MLASRTSLDMLSLYNIFQRIPLLVIYLMNVMEYSDRSLIDDHQ